MSDLFKPDMNLKTRTKESTFKATDRTKDSGFVLKNNQGPSTKAKDNIPAFRPPLATLKNAYIKFLVHVCVFVCPRTARIGFDFITALDVLGAIICKNYCNDFVFTTLVSAECQIESLVL